jgi:tRNA U34 5-methylaminomethyl-2-thiouridine-forming methyltransferase MnmC
MKPNLIKTEDGSHSLYIKELNEHYHSIHGAIQESKHVFINAGLKSIISQKPSSISILEIGLGTGLNALLTFIDSTEFTGTITYTALEAFPISIELAKELNYPELLLTSELNNKASFRTVFNELHSSEWEKEISLSENFIFHKIKNTLQKVEFKNTYDLVYFDAFGPPVQPEMWTEELFSKIFSATNSNGILVTYCAKGEVKRILKKVGFTVESLEGPPGKREMIRALRN